ncbi:hypothetical protein ARMSODRAFT_128722 [Armillaria solidipes]|uniref:F-box domain-containing protein n=1 Tax=Armillaria solidipes TaxID=1076256 RepID=A0A2H3BVU3_9AGAR|nr:hypothetical protein ARMSODRAFT_128722 [Armillaria solidipes]
MPSQKHAMSNLPFDPSLFSNEGDFPPAHEPPAAFAHITSDLLSFLSNNDPFPDLGSARNQRASLLSDIQKIDEDIQRLLERRSETLQAVDDYNTVLSPARSIPLEIWTEIFLHLKDLSPREHYLGGLKHYPWILSYVCRTWRAVALSCGAFWQEIRVIDGVRCKDPLALLDTILSRCGHYIDFQLIFRRSPLCSLLEMDIASPKSLFSVLTKYFNRWRDVALHITRHTVSLLTQVHGRLQSLTTLELWCLSREIDCIRGFEIAPRLVSLKLYGWKFETRSVFPWCQLVHFSDRRRAEPNTFSTFPTDFIRESNPTLGFLQIDALQEQSLATPIIHSHLTTLQCSSASFIDSLILPALTTISINPCRRRRNPEPEGVLPAIHALISWSHCVLTSLNISDTSLIDDLYLLLDSTPRLIELAVDFPRWRLAYDRMIQELILALTEKQDDVNLFLLVPHLKLLSISSRDVHNTKPIGFLDDDFGVMIGARKAWAVKIELMAREIALSPAGRAHLYKLQEDGMDLFVEVRDYQQCRLFLDVS